MTAMVFMVGLSPAIEAKSARHFGKKRKLADGTPAVKPVELRDLSICRDCASMGHVQPHPTPRSLHPRKVHQRTNIRPAARQRVFRKIPEGPISDRDRKLARASVQEYRVHHEAIAGAADLMAKGWKRPFDEPIPLPRGRQLVTLRTQRSISRSFRRPNSSSTNGRPQSLV